MSNFSVEYITAIMRHHPEGGMGEPFDFTCTLLLDGKNGIIKAASGNFSQEIKSKLEEKLTDMGLQSVTYTRRGRPKGAKNNPKE